MNDKGVCRTDLATLGLFNIPDAAKVASFVKYRNV